VAFIDQIQILLAGLEKYLDLPYADVLEMPILWVITPTAVKFAVVGAVISAFILTH
jgi:hypothetical protein